MNGSSNITEIEDVPEDYISDIKLIYEKSMIVVTAWDGSISLYTLNGDIHGSSLYKRFQYEYPILSCCYKVNDDSSIRIYFGTVQGEILRLDIQSGTITHISNNYATLGIIRLFCCDNNVIAGSWDGSIQIVDCQEDIVVLYKQLKNCKILSMDCDKKHLVIAGTSNTIHSFNLPLTEVSEGKIESSALKFQVRDIKIIPDGTGYVISSIDGRVAVEYFDDNSKQFAFRCHRMNLTDVQFVFPVNTLSFKPQSDNLFTGGSDSCVSCWSLNGRKKIKQYSKFDDNSVVKITSNDKVLVVGTSDDSFKTNAVVSDANKLQASKIYLVQL